MKGKKGKRGGMGKVQARVFTLHVIFVLLGLRSAYLVDAAPMNAVEVEVYLKIITAAHSSWAVEVVVISLDMDVVVMLRSTLEARVAELARLDWGTRKGREKVVVGLIGNSPATLSPEELLRARSDLLSALERSGLASLPQPVDVAVDSGGVCDCISAIHHIFIVVQGACCPVFVAGWLLDYPAIYFVGPEGKPALLAMQECKVLYAGVLLNEGCLRDVGGQPTELELIQCTIPTAIIDTTAGLASQLERCLMLWQSAIPSGVPGYDLVTRVKTKSNELIQHSTVAI